MADITYQPRGQYFEDFGPDQVIVTAGRTITEADIVNFAGLSGDYNQIHTDAAYAAIGSFGQRVAHGLLVQSIGIGLAVQSGLIEGTVLAFRELNAKFNRPVYIGDTIHVKIEISDLRPLPRMGGGNVTMKYRVYNQDDRVVQRGEWLMLVKSRA